MDKTIEIVIAVTVLLITALSVIFMVGDRAGGFNEWANNSQQGAQCDLLKAEYQNSCKCPPEVSSPEGDDDIKTDAEGIDGCTWPTEGGGYSCNNYCNN